METYLSVKQIERLVGVFANEEKYTEYLKTLWALRRVVGDKMELEMGLNIDKTHPLYKIHDLCNVLINAIDDGSVGIANGEVYVDKKSRFDR